MGARLNGIQEVTGSIPVRSTNPSLRSAWLDRTVLRHTGFALRLASVGTIPVRSTNSKSLISKDEHRPPGQRTSKFQEPVKCGAASVNGVIVPLIRVTAAVPVIPRLRT